MFERFAEDSRKVMQYANMEAQRLNHEYIGTEHILLGMLRTDNVGCRILLRLGINLTDLSNRIRDLVQPGPDQVMMGKLPQTQRAKKVIEMAIESARELARNYVGSEHILMGLLIETEGIASTVLRDMGLSLLEVNDILYEEVKAPKALPHEVRLAESESRNAPTTKPFSITESLNGRRCCICSENKSGWFIDVMYGQEVCQGCYQGGLMWAMMEFFRKQEDLRKKMVELEPHLQKLRNSSAKKRVVQEVKSVENPFYHS